MTAGGNGNPVSPEIITRVGAIDRTSPRAWLLRLDLGGTHFPFSAGQSVSVGLVTHALRKPYSIACSPRQARTSGCLELLVGIGPDGGPGVHLAPLMPGSLVGVRAAAGQFRLPHRLGGRCVLFVAGGTGIAPLRSMMWTALERVVPPAIDVLYSARTAGDLVFDAELRALHRSGRIRYWPTVTRQERGAWRGRRGRIDAAILSRALRGRAVCAVCGPAGFAAETLRLLEELGVRRSMVRREAY